MHPPFSEEILDRYLAGQCTPAEAAGVERMLRAHPSLQQVLDRLLAAANSAPQGVPATQDAWARFEQRLDDLEGVQSTLPWWGLTAQWAHSIIVLGLAFGLAAIATIGVASAITRTAGPAQIPGEAAVSLISAVTNDVAERPLVELALHQSNNDDWLTSAVR